MRNCEWKIVCVTVDELNGWIVGLRWDDRLAGSGLEWAG